jgi:hypothetical protein
VGHAYTWQIRAGFRDGISLPSGRHDKVGEIYATGWVGIHGKIRPSSRTLLPFHRLGPGPGPAWPSQSTCHPPTQPETTLPIRLASALVAAEGDLGALSLREAGMFVYRGALSPTLHALPSLVHHLGCVCIPQSKPASPPLAFSPSRRHASLANLSASFTGNRAVVGSRRFSVRLDWWPEASSGRTYPV